MHTYTASVSRQSRQLRPITAENIAEYLIANNGPDAKRRPFNRGVNIDAELVREGIRFAELKGLAEGWKPWHFDNVAGKWEDYSDRTEALRASFKQRGHLVLDKATSKAKIAPLTSVKAAELESPITVTVGDRIVEVPISGLFALKFQCCIFKAVKFFVEQELGIETAAQLRPYHMMFASRDTLRNPEYLGEVMGKKILELTQSERYKDSPFKVALYASGDELSATLSDTVDGEALLVSVSSFMSKQDILSAMKAGLRYLGYDDFADSLKPYHRSKTPDGTYALGSDYLTEILVRNLDKVCKEKFNGSRVRMLMALSIQEHFVEPLWDNLVDPKTGIIHKIPISTVAVASAFGNRRWDIIQAYLKAKGDKELLKRFKPYHLEQPIDENAPGARALRNEFLKRHIHRLVQKAPYNGNVELFVKEATGKKLCQPFIENFGGERVEVSTRGLYEFYGQSPRKMIAAYLKITQQTTLEDEQRSQKRGRTNPNALTVEKQIEILINCIHSYVLQAQNRHPEDPSVHITYRMMRTPYILNASNGQATAQSPYTAWRRWSRANRTRNADPLEEIVGRYNQQYGKQGVAITFERTRRGKSVLGLVEV